MAITTVNGIVSGLQAIEEFIKVGGTMEAAGVPHSFAFTSGRPGSATVPSSGLNGAALTSWAGQIPFSNPGAGNTYLAMFEAMATQNGALLLVDRLWENQITAVTTTTAQSITHPGLPSRDSNGAALGANVLLGIEVSTATTNGSAITNMTASYTNQAGTASKTATIASFPATAAAGSFIPFQLAAGDSGVRSVQSITLGTSLATGVVHLVQYRVLASLGMLANVTESKDWQLLGLPRLFDNTVPQLIFVPSATTAATVIGRLAYAQG